MTEVNIIQELAQDLFEVLERYGDDVTNVEVLGVLEVIKAELVNQARVGGHGHYN